MRRLPRCRACGHYGHHPGKGCPLRNLLADERVAERERVELSRMFPNNPELRALLESLQASWRKKGSKAFHRRDAEFAPKS